MDGNYNLDSDEILWLLDSQTLMQSSCKNDGLTVFSNKHMERWRTYHGLMSVLVRGKTVFMSIVFCFRNKTVLVKMTDLRFSLMNIWKSHGLITVYCMF